MAQKLITELQLISSLTDSTNLPVDNGIQSYRATMPQVYNYIRPLLSSSRTISAAGTSLTAADRVVFLDPTSESFVQELPACASLPVGLVLIFKNIALPSNGNTATLDANSTELIDAEETLVLNSFPVMDSVTLYNTGTKWLRLG
jgi:hypothetical protein